ncbi:MAG: CAP domain-containing protein [Bacteroidetes bacterium]|nr:CAP domain-containing protein [Bacteroidota bacterium]
MKLCIILLSLCLSNGVFAQMSSVVLNDPPLKISIQTDQNIIDFNENQPGFNLLNPMSRELYYWTNFCRSHPKIFWDSIIAPILSTQPDLQGDYAESLKKELFSIKKLPYLNLNAQLIKIAQSHASDIGLKNAKISHTSTDGRTFVDRFSTTGLKNCGGENVSYGNEDPLMDIIILLIDANLPSLGHRKAILSSKYTLIGLGVSYIGQSKNLFSVQDFACPQ